MVVLGTLNRAMPAVAVLHVVACLGWTHYTVQLAKLVQVSEAGGGAAKPPAAEPPAAATPKQVAPDSVPVAAAASASSAGGGAASATGKGNGDVLLMSTTAGAVAVDATLATVDEWILSEEEANSLLAESTPRTPAAGEVATDGKESLHSYVDTFDE